jgi:hypothetical protein
LSAAVKTIVSVDLFPLDIERADNSERTDCGQESLPVLIPNKSKTARKTQSIRLFRQPQRTVLGKKRNTSHRPLRSRRDVSDAADGARLALVSLPVAKPRLDRAAGDRASADR